LDFFNTPEQVVVAFAPAFGGRRVICSGGFFARMVSCAPLWSVGKKPAFLVLRGCPFFCAILTITIHVYSKNIYNMDTRLIEIRDKINNLLTKVHKLRTEEWSIIQSSIPLKERHSEPLKFDNNQRTIKWNYGKVRLGPKMYRLLKVIWDSKGHRATISKIEQEVWQVSDDDNYFIDRHTIFTLISRAQKELEKSKFPYKIKTGKNFSTQEIKGFQLTCAPRKNKN
jgi:hypothetical protein